MIITKQQRQAIKKLYDRNADGASSYRSFRYRFRQMIGGYIGGAWCSMFIGIETDGYTHS